MESKTIRILILGDYAVGKTSLLLRYIDNYSDVSMPTLGLNFKKKVILINNCYYNVEIWDTAGQERFRNIPISFYNKADGIILAFDLTNRSTFESIRHWAMQISERASDNSVNILVGNKLDSGVKCIRREEVDKLSEEIGMKYFETSAKENLNVKSTLDSLAYKITVKKRKSVRFTSFILSNIEEKGKCCGKNN